MQKRTGGCNCGKVRFQVEGDPIRVGVCHCQICRKDTGSSFNFFAVWNAKNVAIAGDTENCMHSTDHRHFCVTCGSSLYSVVDGANEVEIRVGAFDTAPSSKPRAQRTAMGTSPTTFLRFSRTLTSATASGRRT